MIEIRVKEIRNKCSVYRVGDKAVMLEIKVCQIKDYREPSLGDLKVNLKALSMLKV